MRMGLSRLTRSSALRRGLTPGSPRPTATKKPAVMTYWAELGAAVCVRSAACTLPSQSPAT